MNKFYISFGQGHAHSVNGKTFDKDCLCEIEAQTENEARTIAHNVFGPVWVNLYEELEGTIEFFPRGVISLETKGEGE